MMNIVLKLGIVFLILFSSCNEDRSGTYVITELISKKNGLDKKECFKDAILNFGMDDNQVTLPGFLTPINTGEYKFEKHILQLNNLEECFFNGLFFVSDEKRNGVKYLTLQNEKIVIKCRKLDFATKSTFNGSI